MEATLTFLQTLTMEQFKAEMKVSTVDVRKNPKTGKLFFTYGSKVGAVSNQGIPNVPVVSEVSTPEGEVFWMLHKEGEGAPIIKSF